MTPPNFNLSVEKKIDSPSNIMECDLDEVWKDALQCLEDARELDESSESSEEDEPYEQHKRRAVMVRLPCGDIHVCGGAIPCPYVEATEGCMVCKYTGIEYGQDESVDEFFDLNGGIGKRSGDPDQACAEPTYGKFTKKPCAIAASRAAFQASKNMDESTIPTYIPSEAQKRSALRPAKRGALCVGEDAPLQRKRNRSSKKNVTNRETCINLSHEAEIVLGKLVNYRKAMSYKRKEECYSNTTKNRDSKMCDESFVFNASVKKYVRGCITTGIAPSIDTINNLAILSRDISAKARRNTASCSTGDELRTAKFRTSFSGIVVALWSACCRTPYMQNARRGTDAYRPFVCGVIYASKRGVTLNDGSIIVPTCPQLAEALPQLRGTGGNAHAKTLHSSSHRGLCTLSRCIASVPQNKQREVFGDLIRMAKQFSSLCFSKRDI